MSDINKTKRGLINELTKLRLQISKLKKIETERQDIEMYKNILDSFPHPFFIIDANDYTIKLANSVSGFSKLNEQSICYANIYNKTEPCDGKEYPCPLATVKKTKKSTRLEHTHCDKDGNVIIFEIHCYPIFDANGEVIRVFEYSIDITERIRIEEELRNKVRFNEQLIQSTIDGYLLADTNGTLIDVNSAYCKMIGYSRSELLKMNIRDLEASLMGEEIEQNIRQMIKSKSVKMETQHKHKNGTIVDLDVSITIMQPDLKPLVAAIIRDITETKRAADALRVSEEKYRTLLDTNPYGIQVIDINGNILYSNPVYQRMVGYTEEELLGKSIFDLIDGNDTRDQTRALLPLLIKNQPEPTTREAKNRTKDGRIIDQLFDWNYMRNNEGRVIGFYSVITDFTDQKKAEEKLQKALSEVKSLKDKLLAENIYLRDEIGQTYDSHDIIGNSPKLKSVFRKIDQVSPTDSTVLILGETGTGKGLIANAIHFVSNRSEKPLIKINCAALPESLIESELFGYEKGAFTGAASRKSGRFELADGGTLLLDEIGELPLDLQPKLLRVLQEGEIERLGGTKTLKVDVRVIAITNRNIINAVESGKLREDLYYRLNVYPITVPPLRERSEDIPVLINYFVSKHATKMGKEIDVISKNTIETLKNYDWPGNVRDLENYIIRCIINSPGTELVIDKLLLQPQESRVSSQIEPLQQVERSHIVKALKATNWRVSGKKGAARLLGMNDKTLDARMRKLTIKRPLNNPDI